MSNAILYTHCRNLVIILFHLLVRILSIEKRMGQPPPAAKATSPIRSGSSGVGAGVGFGSGAGGGLVGVQRHLFSLAAVCVFLALSVYLLRPILVPFVWAVALSVPLHRFKTRLVARVDGMAPGAVGAHAAERLGKFLLGPVFSLLDGYVKAYLRVLAGPNDAAAQQDQSGAIVSRQEPEPWSLWTVKWSVRHLLLSSLFSTNPSVRNSTVLALLVFISTYFTFQISARHTQPTSQPSNSTTSSTPPSPTQSRPTVPKQFWNTRITTLLVWTLVLAPLSTALFFTNTLIRVTPDLLHNAVYFLAFPVPAHVPKPQGLLASVPDLGIRAMVLTNGVVEAREMLLKSCDAELALSFPAPSPSRRNVTCIDAARMAVGGLAVYEEALFGGIRGEDVIAAGSGEATAATGNSSGVGVSGGINKTAAAAAFRSRFPQVVEVIELAAYGRRLGMLGKLGPAVAEVRWMGLDAFLPESLLIRDGKDEVAGKGDASLPGDADDDDDYAVEEEKKLVEALVARGNKEDYDPTGSVPGIVGPIVADLAFSGLVFFSTIWVLVASDIGVLGYLAKVTGRELAGAVLNPLVSSFQLNAHLFFFRIFLVHLVSCLAFPKGSEAFSALLPFVAFLATLWPMFPPFLPLGVVPAIVLFVAYKSPLAAAATLYVHLIFSPEGDIVSQEMGVDGIGVVDGFSLWMGWMAFGEPAGLLIGPWAFISLRKCFRHFVGEKS
ncbi:hypothetical protein BC830DRAFT_597272 [Chytriomyces sp. MP71]|nr:hypothetical protein BC830DRAFT_597272 [Chytriomyces sp. MP71]